MSYLKFIATRHALIEPAYLYVPISIADAPPVPPIDEIIAKSDARRRWHARPWWKRAIEAVRRVPEPPELTGAEFAAIAVHRFNETMKLSLASSLFPPRGQITGWTE